MVSSFPVSSVYGLISGIVVHQEDTEIFKVIDIQELTRRRAVAPAGNFRQIVNLCFMEAADQCRKYVAVGWMIVIVLSVKIGWHNGNIISSVLTVQKLTVF